MRTRVFGTVVWAILLAVGLTFTVAEAQDDNGGQQVAPGMTLDIDEDVEMVTSGFWDVVGSGGILGIILWLSLLAASVAGIALIVDSFITIRAPKIAPETLVSEVREAMEQGDVMKALKHCEENPVPLSNILSAGFTNVEEGFEAIQDAVAVAAELEGEKLMQRVNYLNVVGNLSPMLGLLGTVQGMIAAFATLATAEMGAAQQSMLAQNISQALFTTAAGLAIAVPAVAFFYLFRNKATTIILNMEGTTMDLIKVFRNVEVVDE